MTAPILAPGPARSAPSLRPGFPLWLPGPAASVMGVLSVVIVGRSRESERLLYARLPAKTFANSLRHGWLPEPVTASVQALAMRAGSSLIAGRAVSIVFGVAVLFVVRAVAQELEFGCSRVGLGLLLTNGVLLAQGVFVDPAVQQALAAAVVTWVYIRRSEKPGVASYVFAGAATAGACSVAPRMVFLVAALAVVDVGLSWRAGRRWEVVLLGPLILGGLACSTLVAYRTKLAGDLLSDPLWQWTQLSHVVVTACSMLALRLGLAVARTSPRHWFLVAWIAAGLPVTGWSALRSGPPVWWSIPAIWMVWLAANNTDRAAVVSGPGRSTRTRPLIKGSGRTAGLGSITGSGLIVLSALGWVSLLRPTSDVTALSKAMFDGSRLGDQVIFLPSQTRIAFEFHRPVNRLTPVPEYPEDPWGGYPSADRASAMLSPTVVERVIDTATRLWIVTDTSKTGSDIGDIPGLAFLQQQLPEVDTRSGSIRIRSFDVGGA